MLASRSSRTQCFVDHKNLNWMGNFKIAFLGKVHTRFTKYRYLLCVIWVCVCCQNDGKNLPCHTDEEHCEVFPKFCPTCHAERSDQGTKPLQSASCVQYGFRCCWLAYWFQYAFKPGQPCCGLQLSEHQTGAGPLPFGRTGLRIRQGTHCFMKSCKNKRRESGSLFSVSMAE